MKTLRKVVFFLAAGIVFVAAITVITPNTVRAAIATLIQNMDEPGRNPYHQSVVFNQDSTNCINAFVCTANFPVVPAGKRLVVTYASAYYSLTQGGAEQDVLIGVDGNFFSDFQYLAAPSAIGVNRVLVGSPVTYYVDAGHSPSIFLGGNTVDNSGHITAEASIAGYLISVP